MPHCHVKMSAFPQYMRNKGLIYLYAFYIFIALIYFHNIAALSLSCQFGTSKHFSVAPYCTDLESGTLLCNRETLKSGLI